MKRIKVLWMFIVTAVLCMLCAAPSMAQGRGDQGPGSQGRGGPGGGMDMGGARGAEAPLDPSIKRTYVHLAGGAYLYEPVAPGEKSRIAILVMHSDGNYMTHSACTELSKRGYRVFCVNRTGANSLDQVIMNAKQAMTYLRTVPGVQKTVLLGHSGGATLMSSYQMIAENGVKACQGPEKLHKCPNSLADMPPADGVMLLDSNWGNAEMSLFSIDPAVIEEDSGMKVNPDLDLFNPKNGFNPNGNSDYSQEFIHKWQSAVAKREMALTQKALDRRAAIEAGKGKFVEGASHGYNTCKECEKMPGQFGDTQKITYDYVDKWLSKSGR